MATKFKLFFNCIKKSWVFYQAFHINALNNLIYATDIIVLAKVIRTQVTQNYFLLDAECQSDDQFEDDELAEDDLNICDHGFKHDSKICNHGFKHDSQTEENSSHTRQSQQKSSSKGKFKLLHWIYYLYFLSLFQS